MHRMVSHRFLISMILALIGAAAPLFAAPVHTTYLWHMHQPIYWPDRSAWYPSRYETAYETITLGHSQNDEFEIFNKDDRVHDYQDYPKAAVASVLDIPDAGAQVSFASALIENVKSLGDAGWNGGRYAASWYNDYRTARSWTTSGGRSRLPQVLVAAHHPIAPLMDENALRKEILVQKAAHKVAWGDTSYSKGYFPAETCFSERMIPALAGQGIEWVIVADVHLSRACENYPYLANEDNCDPPNKADQLNPAQAYYTETSISRGVTVKTPAPFGFRPHYARYVDPGSGEAHSIKVIPAANAMSWNEGYATYGTGEIDAIAGYNDPAHPMLVLFAHDGDNAWAGGYSYFNENVTSFCHQAVAKGYEPSVVDEYLADHPIDPADVVHVEDGGWVNADGDFGSPQFINWNWPLVNASGAFDIAGGWAEDERNWAVMTAAQNRVETAEEICGTVPDPARIFNPVSGANDVEKAWHHLLSGYESGYMYYGASLDMEIKATLAANAAALYADPVIAGGADEAAPTIWLPQRLPWNPGGKGGGSLWGYPGGEGAQMTSDFWVWTFAYDVSGLARVDLKYRVDFDGANPLSSDQNETYAGGAEVGPWLTRGMTWRDFPAGDFLGDPNIDFTVLPAHIADEYYTRVTGLSEVLVDYYVEAEDSLGFVKRSPIQHVWIGEESSSPSHTIDGVLDTTAALVAAGGVGALHLYADWDGTYLYVAAEGVGATSSLDHFILLGVELSPSASAPWAKSGTVAAKKLFVGNEDSNNWCGWFNESESVLSSDVQCASGGCVEGLVKLETYLGSPLPAGVYLAVSAYDSPDGGSLAAQAPDGNEDGNVDAAEYVYFPLAAPTDVDGEDLRGTTPKMPSVFPARPNPFSASTRVDLVLRREERLSVDIYDVRGRRVKTLASGQMDEGRHELAWDGRDSLGRRAAPGIYFIRVAGNGHAQSQKLILLR